MLISLQSARFQLILKGKNDFTQKYNTVLTEKAALKRWF